MEHGAGRQPPRADRAQWALGRQLCLLPDPTSGQVNAAGFFQERWGSKPISSDISSSWGTMLLPVPLWLVKRLILEAQQLFSYQQPGNSGEARQCKLSAQSRHQLSCCFQNNIQHKKNKTMYIRMFIAALATWTKS